MTLEDIVKNSKDAYSDTAAEYNTQNAKDKDKTAKMFSQIRAGYEEMIADYERIIAIGEKDEKYRNKEPSFSISDDTKDLVAALLIMYCITGGPIVDGLAINAAVRGNNGLALILTGIHKIVYFCSLCALAGS